MVCLVYRRAKIALECGLTKIAPYPSVFLLALPALLWVEIQSSTLEIDCGLEMLDVPEAASGLFHSLDRRVDGFEARIGDAMLQIGVGKWRWINFTTSAIGARRLWVARQNQRAKNFWAAPQYV